MKNVPNFYVTNSWHFKVNLLLRCVIRVFYSKYLFGNSNTSAASNDLLNEHVLFTCDIAPINSMFNVSIYDVNNDVYGTIFYITFKLLFEITT